MSVDLGWNECEDYFSNVPYAVMLVGKGSGGEKLYFMHPYRDPETYICPAKPQSQMNKMERNMPTVQTYSFVFSL